jgi:hypothetical protein
LSFWILVLNYYYICLFQWQGLLSDTSNAESGSDVDDSGASFVHKVFDCGCLTPVHEEASLSISLCKYSGILFSSSTCVHMAPCSILICCIYFY